jgi:hypothetical protein
MEELEAEFDTFIKTETENIKKDDGDEEEMSLFSVEIVPSAMSLNRSPRRRPSKCKDSTTSKMIPRP